MKYIFQASLLYCNSSSIFL